MSTPARWACALALGIAAAGASAQGPYADALAGRVAHIKASRVVHLGYRDDAIPFSYVPAGGVPTGYSLDLCRAVVATLADDLGVPLAVEYVRVTAQDRIARVTSGAVDLECGATTRTAKRRELVAFSPLIFVTGTRLAVARGSAIRDVTALSGRRVVVVAGTTNEAAMREIDRRRGLRATFVVVAGYADALAALAERRADAFAADEVLLRGLLAQTGRSGDYRIVGPLLSFEPYGLVYPRGEAALGDAIERTLRGLAESREIVWLYDRWFTRPLPDGATIGLPMGIELRRSFELIGLPPD